ncbi:tRNA methyltransferase [Dirofilaria immitis]
MDVIRSMECFIELLDALEESRKSEDNELSSSSHTNKTYCKQTGYMRVIERRRLNRSKERRRHRKNQAKNLVIKEPLSFVLQVCIDFGFAQRLQKKSPGLKVMLLSPDQRFLCEGRRKISGFDYFSWIISTRNINEFATEHHIIYLSPDSQLKALLDVKSDEVYVIGGLVDETGVGSLSYHRAEELGLDARRLPIQEFLRRRDSGTFNVMLTINQVVEILVRYVYSKS